MPRTKLAYDRYAIAKELKKCNQYVTMEEVIDIIKASYVGRYDKNGIIVYSDINGSAKELLEELKE
jgi:hypothetical protein